MLYKIIIITVTIIVLIIIDVMSPKLGYHQGINKFEKQVFN